MRIKTDWLARWATKRMMKRANKVIGNHFDPYMKRWYITPWRGWYEHREYSELNALQRVAKWLGESLPSIYLHRFYKSDDDRALHDHKWPSVSITLTGLYEEEFPANPNDPAGLRLRRVITSGQVVFRNSTSPHRIVVFPSCQRVITLFITGPKIRDWGFWCRKGWVHWKDFTDAKGTGVGKGCD